jgi:hypothetical protein
MVNILLRRSMFHPVHAANCAASLISPPKISGIVKLSSTIANNSEMELVIANNMNRSNVLPGDTIPMSGFPRQNQVKATPLINPQPIVPATLFEEIMVGDFTRHPINPAAGSPKVTAKIAREHKLVGYM